MRNISCKHLAELVIKNPFLYSAKWNCGRNLNALTNLFRNRVEMRDGEPFLTLPVENEFQLKMFSKMLYENRINHFVNHVDGSITVCISWRFVRGNIFENMLPK